jgi:OPA family glycerol-3-phosphate transporter-like MFS transporter
MRISPAAKKAIIIGSACSISYLAVYIARNILGAVSPQMLEKGVFTEENIGSLSSIYFICYALGQLVNGSLGDKIKAKYMIGIGLIMAGCCNLIFSVAAKTFTVACIAYSCTGFFLSMIYGPMAKLVAENVEPIYAPRCSLGYTFASFFGSPLAGVLATFLAWQGVFAVSSIMLFVMGCVVFITFSLFERKGIIQFYQHKKEETTGGSFRALLKHRIVKFTLVAILTGVIRTTVVLWLPTYLSQHLSFSAKNAATIFTVATFIISFAAFIAVFTYERLHRNLDLTIFLSFLVSALCFGVVYLVRQPVANIVFLILAILASCCASAMLWSEYCPSLRDTGMVSGATGFLDCTSYLAAAASSKLFGNAVSVVGWGNLILIWCGLMVAGFLIFLPIRKKANV